MQHAGHGLGVLGGACREHRDLTEPAEVPVHPLLELLDLLRQAVLVEKHGGVGEVHHELARVLQLHEELLDVLRLLFLSHA